VGIIIALSGVEAVANTTGVMQLDPGSTEENPQIRIASRKAILWVMIEVCFFTAFFGLMINALPGLTLENGNINAPGDPEIRDHVLRYMGQYFITNYWDGASMAVVYSSLIGGVFAILLLSAVNTAIVALVSLVFVMSKDGELPAVFQRLTPFGVPRLPLIIATIIPMIILIFVHDIAELANLYAVGFVGAIATNLGVNASDQHTPMEKWERYLMWFTFVIMMAIEITLLIDKPQARMFVFTIVAIGLILRMLVVERRQHSLADKKAKEQISKYSSLFIEDSQVPLHEGAILCAVRSIGKTLNFALQEAKQSKQPLYILFIRNQKVITKEDQDRTWLEDDEACQIFDYTIEHSPGTEVKFFYLVSDVAALAIVNLAEKLRASRLIVGRPRHSILLQMLQGNVIREIERTLPSDIDLLVIS
jgi:nucleotide-binding universal stress UspA family protein